MPRAPLTVTVPSDVADGITDIVARTQRSPAYIALQALSAAGARDPVPVEGGRALALETHEDDPPGVLTKLKAAGKADLSGALTAAWRTTHARFSRWAEREAGLRAAEQADDLDAALVEAAAAETPAERLDVLSRSPYPRVRALVAVHAKTPAGALAKLAQDREPYVRSAVERRA